MAFTGAADPQLGVADGRPGAHGAGAGRVERRPQAAPDPVPQPLLVLDLLAGGRLPRREAGQRLAGGDAQRARRPRTGSMTAGNDLAGLLGSLAAG